MTKQAYIPEPTDPEEVMAALIYAEKVRKAEEQLDQMLIDGLKSGPPIEMEDLDWESLERLIQAAANQGGPPMDSDPYRRARLELDEKIIEGLRGPFLTEEEWELKLEEMKNSIPKSARKRKVK